MPDTTGQSGIEAFEAHAKAWEERSSDTALSTLTVQEGTGGDGHIVLQERGDPAQALASKSSKRKR